MKRLSSNDLGFLSSAPSKSTPIKTEQSIEVRCKLLSQTIPSTDPLLAGNIRALGPVRFEEKPPSTISRQLIQEYLDRPTGSGLAADVDIHNSRAIFFKQALQLIKLTGKSLDILKMFDPEFPTDSVSVQRLVTGEVNLAHRYWLFTIARPFVRIGGGRTKTIKSGYYDFTLSLNVGGLLSAHPLITDMLLDSAFNPSSSEFGLKSLFDFKQRMLKEFDASIPLILKRVKSMYPKFKGISLTSCSRSERLLQRCDSFTVFNHHAFIEL